MHGSDYTDSVATPAHASVKIMPKKLQEFPDSTDLTILKNYQRATTDHLSKSLADEPSPVKWRELAEVTMSRIFNARRGSGVPDLRMCEYDKRTNFVQKNVLENMTNTEQQLINRCHCIYSLLILLVSFRCTKDRHILHDYTAVLGQNWIGKHSLSIALLTLNYYNYYTGIKMPIENGYSGLTILHYCYHFHLSSPQQFSIKNTLVTIGSFIACLIGYKVCFIRMSQESGC